MMKSSALVPEVAQQVAGIAQAVPAPALELRGISKAYGKVVASENVDLSINPGEIHGLLGENGAGKSTLMKILLGLEKPDSGIIRRQGAEIRIANPQDARKHGIDMVHQHFSLIGPMAVWENVILGDTGTVNRSSACEQVEQVAQRYGLPIDPLARVDALSAGERQRVELIKCLRREPEFLVLDEPTSVLTHEESEELFDVLRRMVQSENRAVILISHKLAEITAATDAITVLRKGRVVFHQVTSQTTHQELARQMVGRDVSLLADAAAVGVIPDHGAEVAATEPAADFSGLPPALSLQELTVVTDGAVMLDKFSLDVAPGEIVGLYGVEGNGQSVLGDVLSGLVMPSSGSVAVGGEIVDLDRADALTRAGIGIVPEDRHRSGVILALSVAENLAMKSLGSVSGRFLLSHRAMRENAQRLMTEYSITAPSVDAPVGRLSGGNQQRLVLARELSNEPRVMVVAQPTQGLDIGAIEDMYGRIRTIASQGIGVLLISTELEEIMTLASRVAVISSGILSGILAAEDVTAERLGMMVGGAS
ncbi:ABC transporter ATP-binding protein [Aeromicrobium sp. P5_D10]